MPEPTRRTRTSSPTIHVEDLPALSIGEWLARIEGKFDAFTASHEARHGAEATAENTAHSDPTSTPGGRAILARLDVIAGSVIDNSQRALNEHASLRAELRSLAELADKHEARFDRIYGALAVISAIGVLSLLALLLGVLGVQLDFGN